MTIKNQKLSVLCMLIFLTDTGDVAGASPMHPSGVLHQVPTLAASDSGFYSSYNPGSVQVRLENYCVFNNYNCCVFRTPTTALPQLKVSQSWVEDLGSSQQQFKVNIRLTMIDLEYFVTTLFSSGRRRLSSNADMPDYGSWCSLQRRWMSMVENSLSPSEYNNQSHPDMNLQHFGIKSTSLCQNDSLKYALYS